MNVKEYLKKQAVQLIKNGEMKGRQPKDILMSIIFKDDHIHHVLPKDNDLIKILNSLQEHTNINVTNTSIQNTEMEKFLKKQIIKIDDKNLRGRKPKDILMSIIFDDDHIHHIIPNKDMFEKLVEDLDVHRDKKNIPVIHQSENTQEAPKEIIFHNRQCLGDILTMTCANYDLCY